MVVVLNRGHNVLTIFSGTRDYYYSINSLCFLPLIIYYSNINRNIMLHICTLQLLS